MIVFIDDEPAYVDSYIEEMKLCGLDVLPQKTVDSAMRFLEENQERVELVVLDIMMPPGTAFRDVDTQLGLRTGTRFYEWMRTKAPEVPVIILTNVTDETVERRFANESRCWFFRKDQCLPFQLAEHVRSLLPAGVQKE